MIPNCLLQLQGRGECASSASDRRKIDIKSESQLRAQIEQQLLNYNAEQDPSFNNTDEGLGSLFIEDVQEFSDEENEE